MHETQKKTPFDEGGFELEVERVGSAFQVALRQFLSEIHPAERKVALAAGEKLREAGFRTPDGIDDLEPVFDMRQREVRRYDHELALVVDVLDERAEPFEGDFPVYAVEILPVLEKVVENDDLVVLEKVVRGGEAEIPAKKNVVANPFFGLFDFQSRADRRDERFGKVGLSETGAAGHSHYPSRGEAKLPTCVGEFRDSCRKPLQAFAEFGHFGVLRFEILERGFRAEVFNAVIFVSSVSHAGFSVSS